MYRKAVLDQIALISKQKKDVFMEPDPYSIGTGCMGVYWSIASLKSLLNIYIHKKIDDEGNLINIDTYQKVFDKIDLDFSLIIDNQDMSSIRIFIGELNKWQDLLTIYFSDAGLLPKKRIVGTLETKDIIKIENLEDYERATVRLIPEENSIEILKYLNTQLRPGVVPCP